MHYNSHPAGHDAMLMLQFQVPGSAVLLKPHLCISVLAYCGAAAKKVGALQPSPGGRGWGVPIYVDVDVLLQKDMCSTLSIVFVLVGGAGMFPRCW